MDKSESVGKVFDCYDVKLLDESLNTVELNTPGTVFVKGPGFFDAYISEFKSREDVCRTTDGWFNTGDIGIIDEDGFLFLQGRSKNIINSMGMKVFPQEIEAVLNSHYLIKESLVKAKKHNYLKEVPHALIVTQGEIPENLNSLLLKHCTERLSPFKLPRSFEVVESLPKTGSGKIIRK